jgi:hypothetical protein
MNAGTPTLIQSSLQAGYGNESCVIFSRQLVETVMPPRPQRSPWSFPKIQSPVSSPGQCKRRADAI